MATTESDKNGRLVNTPYACFACCSKFIPKPGLWEILFKPYVLSRGYFWFECDVNEHTVYSP